MSMVVGEENRLRELGLEIGLAKVWMFSYVLESSTMIVWETALSVGGRFGLSLLVQQESGDNCGDSLGILY